MTTSALFTNAQPFTQQSSRLYHQLALTRMQYGKPGPSDSARFSKPQPFVERPLTCEEAAGCVRVHPNNRQAHGAKRRPSRAFPLWSLVFLRIRAGLLDETRVTFVTSLMPLNIKGESSMFKSLAEAVQNPFLGSKKSHLLGNLGR
jgi:hypothetical protein